MSGFTKLFSAITSSSIWNEDDHTRLVWITMLAMADASGVVFASVGGLAHTARVSREQCEKAIERLQSPDFDSRSPEFEGRRIQKVDGGFLLLNYAKYREARSEDERRLYMREYMQEYRKKDVNNRKQKLTRVSHSKPPLAQAEAEAENTVPTTLPAPAAQGVSEGKNGDCVPTTDQSKRIAAIFHRRLTTPWSKQEIKSYRSIGSLNPEDLSALEAYYSAHWPPRREINVLRHSLETFLNNITGEIDRANAWVEARKKGGSKMPLRPEDAPQILEP